MWTGERGGGAELGRTMWWDEWENKHVVHLLCLSAPAVKGRAEQLWKIKEAGVYSERDAFISKSENDAFCPFAV